MKLNSFTNFFLYYFLGVFFLLLVNISCGGDDKPDPSPEPNPSTTHNININGNVPDAIYAVYDNGENNELDGDKANAQGDTKLSFIDKEKTRVVDSITGEADGYKRWVVKNQSIGTSKSYTVNLTAITPDKANLSIKLVDKVSKKAIENLLVVYNGNTTPIDSVFTLNNQSLGEYSLTFKKSDSTWMIIPDITKQVTLEKGDNVFTYEVDATKKQFFANLAVNVDDQDNNAIQGAVLTANNKNATTNANGVATIDNVVELPAQSTKQWLAGTKEQKYNLSKEDYNAVDEQTVTLHEGDNNYNHTLTKKADKTANATFKIQDATTKETIENLLVVYNGNTIALDDTFELKNVPLGEYSLTFKKSDSTWMIIPDLSKVANLKEGDNIFTYEVDATKKQFFANLAVNVDDQDNNDLEGVILSANGKTATSASNGRATITNVAELPAQANKQWLAGTKDISYDLTKDNYKDFTEKTVTLKEGNNEYSEKLEKTATSSNESGDVAISPALKNKSEYGTTITLTNMQTPDSTYTITANDYYASFINIYVANSNNPTQYKIEITDTDTDNRFFKTTTYENIYQDKNFEINGSKVVDLDEIPNEVDITTTVYKSRDVSSPVSNQTVHLVRDSDNATIDTQVTNGSGEISFDDVPGNIVYHLVNEGSGTYKKTNASFKTADVDRMSERELRLNTAAIYILQDINGNDIPGSIVQMYKPRGENTETVQYMYFPPIEGGNQYYKDQAKEFAELLGVEIVPTDTPFPSNPTTTQIAAYHPGPYDKNKDTSVFGINILNYSGGSASTNGKYLPNGNGITFYGDVSLGGSEARLNHHEWGNLYNFPSLNGNDTDFKTSRESSGPQIYSLQDATYDIPVMSEWILTTINQYDAKDSYNIPIEYNKTIKIED